MSSFLSRFFNSEAPIVGARIAEAPAPREAIDKVHDYMRTAIVDATGKRIKEREARATLKLLERL